MDALDVARRIHNRHAARPADADARSWYRIANRDGSPTVVHIYDEIGVWGVTAADLAGEIDDLDVDELTVAVNSPGGSVFDGLAIFNSLRNHRARVTTRVDGIAASAASFIVQAGNDRVMMSGSEMMIHPAQGLGYGDAAVMRDLADLLDKQTGNIASIYAERSGRPADEFLDAMNAGDMRATWYTADEAVEAGLADRVDRVSSSTESNNTASAVISGAASTDWRALFERSIRAGQEL